MFLQFVLLFSTLFATIGAMDMINTGVCARNSEIQNKFFNIAFNDGFMGADVASSYSLGNGNYLWLYGDTVWGHFSGKERIFSSMTRNSIGIVRDNTLHLIGNKTYFTTNDLTYEQWIWVASFDTVNKYVLGWIMEIDHSSILGFRFARNVVFDLNINDFSYDEVAITLPFHNRIQWGACVYRQSDTTALVYGVIDQSTNVAVMLCDNSFSHCQVLNKNLEFSTPNNIDGVKVLFEGMYSEFSIRKDHHTGTFSILSIEAFGSPFITAIESPDLISWSEPRRVCAVDEEMSRLGMFCYAIKFHPEISPFSYTVNCNVVSDFEERIKTNPSLYIPQFLEIHL
ncbi:hypothetical protein PCE1_001266 [Barthelona sp. PCE]